MRDDGTCMHQEWFRYDIEANEIPTAQTHHCTYMLNANHCG